MGAKWEGVGKIGGFQPISRRIAEAVQDRAKVMLRTVNVCRVGSVQKSKWLKSNIENVTCRILNSLRHCNALAFQTRYSRRTGKPDFQVDCLNIWTPPNRQNIDRPTSVHDCHTLHVECQHCKAKFFSQWTSLPTDWIRQAITDQSETRARSWRPVL